MVEQRHGTFSEPSPATASRRFLSTCRIVSWDNAPKPAGTTWFASSRTVQRFRPRGGSPLATARIWAVAWASHLYAPRGRGRGSKASEFLDHQKDSSVHHTSQSKFDRALVLEKLSNMCHYFSGTPKSRC